MCSEALQGKGAAKGAAQFAPFPAPPLLGRVHDLLMTYTKVYRNFCQDVFGGMLLKNRDVGQEAFRNYTTYLQLFSKKIESKKFPVLQKKIWPTYNNEFSQFKDDMTSNAVVWLSKEQLAHAQ